MALNAAIAGLCKEAGNYAEAVKELRESAQQADSAFSTLEVRISTVRSGSQDYAEKSVGVASSRPETVETTTAEIADQVDCISAGGEENNAIIAGNKLKHQRYSA